MGTSFVAKEVPEPRMHLGREDVGRTNLFSHQKSGTAPVVRRPFFCYGKITDLTTSL
jgi:hypothetical protein